MIFPLKKKLLTPAAELLLVVTFACAFAPKPVHALQIEGVEISPQVKVAGMTLHLNGAGMRTLSPMGIPINLYVASFYSPKPVRSEKAALAAEAPLQFNFTFLQGVNKGIVSRVWREQFSHSITETYPGYEHDKDAFLRMVGNLDKYGRDTVEFVGDDTRVLDSGHLIGTIHGRNFQKVYLCVLFGPKPASLQLKPLLLGLSSLPKNDL